MDTFAITDQYLSGEDKTLRFTIYQQPPSVVPRVAQDITGYALSFMIKRRRTNLDASALVTKTVAGGGITIVNGPGGRADVRLDDADIDDLVGGQLYHGELKRTDAGNETILASGTLILEQAVHHA
jgi:hypothetical protein